MACKNIFISLLNIVLMKNSMDNILKLNKILTCYLKKVHGPYFFYIYIYLKACLQLC